MAEPTQTRNRKARERTTRWREKRVAARIPEARQVDRAVLVAFAYSLEKGPLTLDERSLGEIADLAVGLLARHHDRTESKRALARRMRKLSTSGEIPHMLIREADGNTVTA